MSKIREGQPGAQGGKGKPHDDLVVLVPLTTSRRGRLQIITWACLGFGTGWWETLDKLMPSPKF